jgi:hypothetical protein
MSEFDVQARVLTAVAQCQSLWDDHLDRLDSTSERSPKGLRIATIPGSLLRAAAPICHISPSIEPRRSKVVLVLSYSNIAT